MSKLFDTKEISLIEEEKFTRFENELPILSREDIEELTRQKRQEEADDRDRDISNGWEPSN